MYSNESVEDSLSSAELASLGIMLFVVKFGELRFDAARALGDATLSDRIATYCSPNVPFLSIDGINAHDQSKAQ